MPDVLQPYELSLQQRVLAWGMLRQVGNAATSFILDQNGIRRHQIPRLTAFDMERLEASFAIDPKESMAMARESLFAIYEDSRLDAPTRTDRLERYYDAYTELIIHLDHATFPPTPEGHVSVGLPVYIPDGFVDMGGDSSLVPDWRDREQIVVDKLGLLKKYKQFLIDVFSTDYESHTLSYKKRHIVSRIALEVYRSLPYDHSDKYLGGGQVALSTLNEGVCRHQALVFEVLCQAAGIKSQILKTQMDGSRHAANAVRVDGVWYIVDATNPDYVLTSDGQYHWRPGAYAIGEYPCEPGKQHAVKEKHSGREHVYSVHDDMYWRIIRST